MTPYIFIQIIFSGMGRGMSQHSLYGETDAQFKRVTSYYGVGSRAVALQGKKKWGGSWGSQEELVNPEWVFSLNFALNLIIIQFLANKIIAAREKWRLEHKIWVWGWIKLKSSVNIVIKMKLLMGFAPLAQIRVISYKLRINTKEKY